MFADSGASDLIGAGRFRSQIKGSNLLNAQEFQFITELRDKMA
jgi:hypothetical protein